VTLRWFRREWWGQQEKGRGQLQGELQQQQEVLEGSPLLLPAVAVVAALGSAAWAVAIAGVAAAVALALDAREKLVPLLLLLLVGVGQGQGSLQEPL